MKPETLSLTNIGPFQGYHKIDFSALGDIFLIYGKTGAGKTTIFDALAFAFYGAVPGARKEDPKSLRSHFAAEGEDSMVELVFTLAGRRYRIRRIPPDERIGVRSGKLQQIQAEVSFDELVQDEWKSRTSTNRTDTDREIIDLIGLSADEFSRIVLLPQGEFAQFLQQKSKDRKEVLAKLFPVDIYSRVIDLAHSRALEASRSLKVTEQNLIALQKEEEALPEGRSKISVSDSITELRQKQTDLRKTYTLQSAELAEARAATARGIQLARMIQEREKLNSEEPTMDALSVRIRASRRARPLQSLVDRLENAQKTRGLREKEIDLAEKDLQNISENLLVLEAKVPETAKFTKEREELLVRKEKLQIALKLSETIQKNTDSLSQARTALNSTKKERDFHATTLEDATKRLTSLAPEAGNLDNLSQEHQNARDALESARLDSSMAENCERERKVARAHHVAVETVKAEIAGNRKDTSIARAELEDLRTLTAQAEKAHLAERLAQTLEEGIACPVCGSTEHPSPAGATADIFAPADRLAAGERRIETLEATHNQLQQELARKETGLHNAEERIATYTVGKQACEAIPEPEHAALNLSQAVQKAQETADKLAQARTAWRESETLRQKQTEANTALSRLAVSITTIQAQVTEAQRALAATQERWKEAGLEEGTDPGEAYEICTSRNLEIEAKISSRETRLREAHVRRSSIEGTLETLRRSLETILPEIEQLERECSDKATTAGFHDSAEIKRALMDVPVEEKAEAEIASWKEQRHATENNITRLKAEESAWTGLKEADALHALSETENAMQGIDGELEKASASFASIEALEIRREKLETERANRSLVAGRLQSLSDDLTGSNSGRISFDAWILGIYLEEITAFANTRLERMSEGRYRIQLNDTYRKKHSQPGLELEIVDAWTGKARPSATLSGGETFMASISLALGLADSIQSRAGGIQLDAIFIDEGFGSLDESTLERSISILDEIRGNRMVGIISHVSELRSRIPALVEVIKTGTGSYIQQGDTH